MCYKFSQRYRLLLFVIKNMKKKNASYGSEEKLEKYLKILILKIYYIVCFKRAKEQK